jgi:hypothetical protein
MRPVLLAFSRAVLSQMHYRMLLLAIVPFLLSVAIWGGVLWLTLQPMIDALHAWFLDHGWFSSAGDVLNWLGLGTIKAVLVPLLAMWLLLPLMILTALVFVGTIAMPIVVRHVGRRRYRDLEEKKGGSLFGTFWISTYSFIIFAVLWIVTLPLTAIPPLTFVVQPVLWGWLTYRVMAYDALSLHGSADEIKLVMRSQRWPLLAIGIVAGAMGAAPTLLWLGGALSVIFFPLLAAGAILLYVLVFIFSGLWFAHFCLEALAQVRKSQTDPEAVQAMSITPSVIPRIGED